MNISSRDFVIILLGIVGTLLLTLLFGSKLYSPQELSTTDYLLFGVVAIIAIVLVIHKRIGEVESDLDCFGERLSEMAKNLKRAEDLVGIKSDLISLKKFVENGEKK
ncbi:MAG: hypothetical protein KJ905_04145 [Nanoarchaeota archaeon]|nr:hypothetical protein [Nanoarchaeota archaeon]MBU1501931.1 hypothetical protein [Nanoarchaeota archaeon]MBU2459169.1 hypothetical protein [Nanoarchaeota archaeon]